MDVTKDGCSWRIGTANDVAWIVGKTTNGLSITTAIPPVFDAYATFYPPDFANYDAQERAVVDELTKHTPDQPWWLGYLDTGAQDIVFALAPMADRSHARRRIGGAARSVLPRRSLLARLRPLGRHLDRHRRPHRTDHRLAPQPAGQRPPPSGPTKTPCRQDSRASNPRPRRCDIRTGTRASCR